MFDSLRLFSHVFNTLYKMLYVNLIKINQTRFLQSLRFIKGVLSQKCRLIKIIVQQVISYNNVNWIRLNMHKLYFVSIRKFCTRISSTCPS